MCYYSLKDLNIKLVDFISLLSPLGSVRRIISNGDTHLAEICFHNSISLSNNKNQKEKDILEETILKIYKDNIYGFIINNNIGIIEIPKGIDEDNSYLSSLKKKDKESISKYIRKNIPKDCMKLVKNKIMLEDCNQTDPEKVNISTFPGYSKVNI